jgi:hypothetical protein
MKKQSLIQTLGGIAIIGILATIAFWHSGHRPIAYHNDNLEDLIGSAIRLELSLVPKYGQDGSLLESEPPVFINDRAEIDKILQYFELPWHLRASNRFHECGGHFIVRVIMPDAREYKIRYDHGNGIYPLYSNENPGFCDLPVQACDELNKIFKSMGFSSRDLGISEQEGEQAVRGNAEPATR